MTYILHNVQQNVKCSMCTCNLCFRKYTCAQAAQKLQYGETYVQNWLREQTVRGIQNYICQEIQAAHIVYLLAVVTTRQAT